MVRIIRPAFFGSATTECFSRALRANAPAVFRSWTLSSETTRSIPSGPRISVRAGTSKFAAAEMSASAAAFGEEKVFCEEGEEIFLEGEEGAGGAEALSDGSGAPTEGCAEARIATIAAGNRRRTALGIIRRNPRAFFIVFISLTS